MIYESQATGKRKEKKTDQLNARIRDRKTASVPPSNGAISNLGFFSKHLLTDFVKMSKICTPTFSEEKSSRKLKIAIPELLNYKLVKFN
jgi:hypothetical protein